MSINAPGKQGVLIEFVDEASYQFIVYKNSNLPESEKFILESLPYPFLFVKNEKEKILHEMINEWVSKNTFDNDKRK